LREALFSDYPEAVWSAGLALTSSMPGANVFDMDTEDITPAINEVAWLMVACEIGMDCSQDGQLGQQYCGFGGCQRSENIIEAAAQARRFSQYETAIASRLAAAYFDGIKQRDEIFFSLSLPED
jgi:hypothetical protein